MRKLRFCLIALCCLSALNLAAPERGSGETPKRLRAVQFTYLSARTAQELRRTFRTLRRSGANTVILRVFQNLGDRPYPLARSAGKGGRAGPGVYFRTRRAPVVADLLPRFVASARREGLKLFAWMSTLKADWALRAHPEWGGRRFRRRDGRLVPTGRLDPFHPEVAGYLEGIFRDLVQHRLDGVLIQDDLVSRHTHGFGPEAARAYRRRFGRPIDPNDLYFLNLSGRYLTYKEQFWNWARWKRERLARLAGRVAKVVHDSGARVALNLYYETVLEARNALAWFSQDLRVASALSVDYLAVMAYQRQMSREKGYSWGETLKALRDIGSRLSAVAGESRSLVKLQSVDWKCRCPVRWSELREAYRAASLGGSVSVSYFAGGMRPGRQGFYWGLDEGGN